MNIPAEYSICVLFVKLVAYTTQLTSHKHVTQYLTNQQ
jgi:hypothetical protein